MITLQRMDQSESRTLGTLIIDDDVQPVCVTLELPWLDNQKNVSCIPAGWYTANRRFSPKHGYDLFWIDDVPARGAIEIHIGNYPKDTLGCVLLGQRVAEDGESIEHSKVAFEIFMERMEGIDSFPIEVRDVV